MHDLKYANEIISVIKSKAPLSGIGKPPKTVIVNIRLSPFSHVTPDGLNGAFKQIAMHENIATASLNIRPLEYVLQCNGCKKSSTYSAPAFSCPFCGGADFNIDKGSEFVIDSLDIGT